MTCSFVKFGYLIGIFLDSANLICRSTDISKCFRGSLRLRDNESRLYYQLVGKTSSSFFIIHLSEAMPNLNWAASLH